MIDTIDIRDAQPGDSTAIETLYPAAFPDEDLLPLMKGLQREGSGVVSLVGFAGNALAGHVAFTACGIVEESHKVALLAPLAVAPDRQRQGVGSALVRAGLQRLRDSGISHVFTLGDPAYYGRFGFAAEDDVAPPYPLPEAWHGAWQSLRLSDEAPRLQGKLTVPAVWRNEALWLP